MLDDDFLEEEIWEYKSKRKLKPVHQNHDPENSPKSAEKATDGKHKAKRHRNKKQPNSGRTVEAKEKAKDEEGCDREAPSQTSVASGPESGCAEDIQASQDKQGTPGKHRRAPKNKQVSPKIRPVYDGNCPNCQVPFSSLLGQTPRWHVFECLDSPQVSETECPDGLLCTSTIPAHYKRYTHFLLAQTRAGSGSLSSPPPTAPGVFTCSSETTLGFLGSLSKRGPPKEKGIENFENIPGETSLGTQGRAKSQSATQASQKVPVSTKAQRALTFSGGVPQDKLPGVALPLAVEVSDSPPPLHLPRPEHDTSNCEISYSPLQSDEELEGSQQDLFSMESSKAGGPDERHRSLFSDLRGASLQRLQESRLFSQSQDEEDLDKYHTLAHLSQLLSQDGERAVSCDRPADMGDCFMMFTPASAGAAAQEAPFPRAKDRKQAAGKSAVHRQVSLPLLETQVLTPFTTQGERHLPFRLSQSNTVELPGQDGYATNCSSLRFCGVLESNISGLNSEPFPSTPPAATPGKTGPSAPEGNTRHSNKAMKQMDIGVYFGLPPKRKEEKLPEESPLKGANSNRAVSPKDKKAWSNPAVSPKERKARSNPAVSPKEKRAWSNPAVSPKERKPPSNPAVSPKEKKAMRCKWKAETSLSEAEPDAKSRTERQLPVELSSQGAQRQRKRRRKSSALPEGASGESEHIRKTESGPVNVNKGRGFRRAAGGGLPGRPSAAPEFPNAEGLRKRQCPFYKQIPGTGFTVDAFQYGLIEGCTAYFLTHFHSDHYSGLSRKFTAPVYCSQITGNLLKSKLHVQEQYIHPLPMDTECIVNGVKVVLLDANHCPGAVMILFYLPNGTVTLHTGDFRADPTMERSLLAGLRVHTLYLDTTYCSPEYSFPSQQEVIQFAINTAFEAVTLNPRVLVVCGTYSIGKEKVFLAIADVLGSKVAMSQEKYTTLRCLNIPDMDSLITTDMCGALVHLLPMMQITFKGLQKHLKACGGKYNQILAFRPTGWTHSNKLTRTADIAPQTRGNISIYGIPYSEHSSYLEMKRFVQWLKPKKIIPTVNVGTWRSRGAMDQHFREWRLEAGY
ncbi:DNA cross-link repair 1A protein [Echinops telfairi]|uniref:DNA cross-link repair 1A protein n=2 Tax=Echinops telfairi TaxID=9371 RepID=A0AC55D713_ECHTE|nr:DNA cross-link repair 1A protein [Echinops telfairi]XP_045147530.1 DNA cross-link repair 1A protein [Echinops telfairi]